MVQCSMRRVQHRLPLSGEGTGHSRTSFPSYLLSGGPAPDSGRLSGVDPRNIETAAELATALGALVHAHGRSLRELTREARKLPGHAALPPSTVSDVLRERSMPAPQTLGTLLTVCGVPAAELPLWLAARERAAASGSRRAPGAVRTHTARGRLFGVHASIHGDDELPAYVRRDLDGRLRAALAVPGLVVLVGGSSVGKTRSAFEAVRAVLPQWWLLQPADARAVHALAADPPPRTVIWLDEMQNYLDGELGVAPVQALIGSGTVLVGTLWPDEYSIRTAPRTPHQPDPYAENRRLLDLATVIDVPDTFSPAELGRARTLARDPRIRIALDAPDAGFTQVLAAGPELVRRWEQAPCYGRAVITAAIDARRVGCQAPLTREFLEAAAPGYLRGAEQATAPEDWLDQALRYATARLHGATSALVPAPAAMGRAAGWTVADYLYQHARQVRRTEVLPDAAWQALVERHHPGDRRRLADNAARRGRWPEAAALGHRPPVTPAAQRIAMAMGGHLCAEELRERAATDDDAYRTAARLADREDLAELRRLAAAGDQAATGWLVRVLTRQDRTDEAVVLLREAAGSGSAPAARRLAEMLAAAGHLDEAVGVLRERADAGSVGAAHQLVGLLTRHGRISDLAAETAAGTAGAAVAYARFAVTAAPASSCAPASS